MRVYETRVIESGDYCELHAMVKCDTHWVWGDEPFPLWYRYPAEYREFLNPENGDPFIATCLLPAMALGEPLEIEAAVSQKLYSAIPKIQSIYHSWDDALTEVAVRSATRPSHVAEDVSARSQARVGLFFSMGVDSSYSLSKNLTDHPHDDLSITDLIVVEGFDVYLWESERFPPMLASVQHLADQYGKRALPITTNLREFSDRMADWLRLYHGAALASVVMPLGHAFHRVLIASSQTYARLIPRGAHPILDPLWSTEVLSFDHDGLEANRLQKVQCLAKSETLVENLRVCTTGEITSSYNCGHCEKCVRTMIGLHIAGALNKCKTLPHEIDLSLVRKLCVPHSTARQYLEELVRGLGSTLTDSGIKAALRECLAAEEPGNTPVISVTGTNGKTTTTRMIAHILAAGGKTVGYATTTGVYIGTEQTIKGDMAGVAGARAVLDDPAVEVAVLETSRGGLVKNGLGYLSCDIGVCLNVREDHLGFDGIESLDDLACVKRLVIESARGVAVLNAQDPRCVAMEEHTAAAAVCYVSLDPQNAVVRRHIDKGGIGAVIEGDGERASLVVYDKREKRFSLVAHRIPATLEGKAMHNVHNALFAAAATYCLGTPVTQIAARLQTFANSFEMNPGRLNVLTTSPFTIILDFGHNPDGIQVVCETFKDLQVRGQRIAVLTSSRNKNNRHFNEIGRVAAGFFDHVICTNRLDLDGGDPKIVPLRLRDALIAQHVESSRITVCLDSDSAVKQVFSMLAPGDLVIFFCKDHERIAEQIQAGVSAFGVGGGIEDGP